MIGALRLLIDEEIWDRMDQVELAFNHYGHDPLGISKAHLAVFFSLFAPLYRRYFEVQAFGLEHVPDSGRAMLVGNHSGGIPIDAAMLLNALFLDKTPPRIGQAMADKFVNRWPFISQWSNRLGHFTGLPEHAERLLEDDRLLVVFPEGARGTAKLYRERNSLVRFGTGFLRLALKTGTPIVPFAFVGGGDAMPTVHNSETIGRLLGAPYVPFTPYLLPLPLPVNCQIYVGEPMIFDGDGSEEDDVIQRWVAEIKDEIARLIDLGVEQRGRGGRVAKLPAARDAVREDEVEP